MKSRTRCEGVWLIWAALSALGFTYLELRGFRRKCHPTLSRELQRWTRSKQCRWSPLVFTVFGAWLSWHIAALKDLPSE